MFYKLFLSDACLGKACYEKCKYKYDKSAADIRIGDLWGKTYEKEEKGVSGAIAFTEKGLEVLNNCNSELIEHPFNTVAEGQIRNCIKLTSTRQIIIQKLQNAQHNIITLKKTINNLYLKRNFKNILKHPRSSIISIIKIIFS